MKCRDCHHLPHAQWRGSAPLKFGIGRRMAWLPPVPGIQRMPIKRTCQKGHKFFKTSDCPTCPKCEAARRPGSGLLSLLSAPACRAFERARIFNCSDLSRLSEQEILGLHGVGPSTLPILREQLSAKGLTFRHDPGKSTVKASPKRKV